MLMKAPFGTNRHIKLKFLLDQKKWKKLTNQKIPWPLLEITYGNPYCVVTKIRNLVDVVIENTAQQLN